MQSHAHTKFSHMRVSACDLTSLKVHYSPVTGDCQRLATHTYTYAHCADNYNCDSGSHGRSSHSVSWHRDGHARGPVWLWRGVAWRGLAALDTPAPFITIAFCRSGGSTNRLFGYSTCVGSGALYLHIHRRTVCGIF